MFRWYQRAAVCYAYLADIPSHENPQKEWSAFRTSREGLDAARTNCLRARDFSRCDWQEIGSKLSLQGLVSEVTKIHLVALMGGDLDCWNAAQEMSWASDRTTTREEDIAYCLMGIFDINMPMLYGEGMKAFIRLQEEIIRISHDQTILAWRSKPSLYGSHDGGLLANGPHLFAKLSNVASSGFEVGGSLE